MDIMKIRVRSDGTTIGQIKTLDDAEIAIIELEFNISSLKNELDDAWADRVELGKSAAPSWLADTRAELRELEAARSALRLYAKKLKAEATQDKQRIRQTIMLECAREMMTDEQWQQLLDTFHHKLNLLQAGTYTPRGWVIKEKTRTGEAA